jgi:hypothetical protein
MRHLWVYGCAISLWVSSLAFAQLPQIENYSGGFWSRPALTGDWGGLRNTLATKGINLNVDLLQSLQGINSGGSAWLTARRIPSSNFIASALAARGCSTDGIATGLALAIIICAAATICLVFS